MKIEKLIQVTGYLLRLNGFRMSYLKAMKILYLADRESLSQANQTITEDSFVSMKHGPVLSGFYDLVKKRHRNKDMQAAWDSRFSTDGYDLIANFDRIPDGKLSVFEKQTIAGISEQFRDTPYGKMIDYVHAHCPEWEDPGETSKPIPVENILESLGRTPEEINYIMAEIEAFDQEDAAFASLEE
jgi:uncharacterized phage-associated protein